MKKIVLTALALACFLLVPMPAQDNSANDFYIQAITTNDPNQRAQLLKEYVKKFAGKGTQYENFAYAHLCTLPYKGKTPQETIEYGEKALALGGLDDFTSFNIYITVSSIYSQLAQNLEKAKNYAFQAIQIAQANKNNRESEQGPEQWIKLEGAAYYAQAQALEKVNDLKGAVHSYINSYNILKNKQIINNIAKIGKSLYDSKSYTEAEEALKIAATVLKDSGSISLYAKTLHRNGKKDEALTYYKQAYMKEKSGDIVYNIGIILAAKAKSNPALAGEAIQYLLESSFLSPTNSEKAMSLAENLFFFTAHKELKYNEKVKELSERTKKIEEFTNSFNKKFGEKDEDDLTGAEKKEMKEMLAQIDLEKKAIEKLQEEQKAALEKFNSLIQETKKKLGIQ